MSRLNHYHAWHAEQQRQFDARQELKDERQAAEYAADQAPVAESPEDSETVTDYLDRRGK